jgi:hypothetical protein
MGGRQPGYGAGEQRRGGRREACDGQAAGETIAHARQFLRGGRDFAQHLAGVTGQRLTGRCRPGPPGVPVEERRTRGLLGHGNLARHGGLRVTEPPGGRAEGSGARHFKDDAQTRQRQVRHRAGLFKV